MNVYKLFVLILCLFHMGFGQDEFDQIFTPQTSIGGYGELHYNYSKKDKENPVKVLDFHRFVLFFSYSWTEKWFFYSELELEHNYVKDGQGELELEQAFVNYSHSKFFAFQIGVVLPAVGLINEYHEPPLFLSVERPDYAKYIIPATWFGNGLKLYGEFSGFNYKLTVMEGLNAAKISAKSGIRDARLKGYKVNAGELLYNMYFDYVKLPGLKIGFSYSFTKALSGDSLKNAVNIFELHGFYNTHDIYITAEYGNINIKNNNLENSHGYYVDIGYNIANILNQKMKIIPWFRWSDINTAAKTKTGGFSEKEFHFTKWLLGLSIKPIDNVVFKIDYGILKRDLDKQETKLFNFGAGYMF